MGVSGNPIALTITWSFALFPDAEAGNFHESNVLELTHPVSGSVSSSGSFGGSDFTGTAHNGMTLPAPAIGGTVHVAHIGECTAPYEFW